MGTRKKTSLEKIDLAIWLALLVMLLCAAGIVVMGVLFWFRKPLHP